MESKEAYLWRKLFEVPLPIGTTVKLKRDEGFVIKIWKVAEVIHWDPSRFSFEYLLKSGASGFWPLRDDELIVLRFPNGKRS